MQERKLEQSRLRFDELENKHNKETVELNGAIQHLQDLVERYLEKLGNQIGSKRTDPDFQGKPNSLQRPPNDKRVGRNTKMIEVGEDMAKLAEHYGERGQNGNTRSKRKETNSKLSNSITEHLDDEGFHSIMTSIANLSTEAASLSARLEIMTQKLKRIQETEQLPTTFFHGEIERFENALHAELLQEKGA